MIWANLAYALVMMVLSYAISYYTARRAQKDNNATAGALDVPTAEEGKNVPVVFGTVFIKDANVIDYFDGKVHEIKAND
jgi:hypothetical protein|nr:MAG TPA: hypothetical protein [Caudoviricetes sp.]DAY13555.1 MAG TPA: hypothetical protein [Caudoviricetes sp.]